MPNSSDDNQSTLFDPNAIENTTTRGTLDLSELPQELRARRPAAHRLHVRLEKLLGIVDLILTDNRRRMLSSRRRRNRQEIRAHHMFVESCDETVAAIADLASGRKGARAHIQQFINDNREAISFAPSDDELQSRGRHFDLKTILRTVRDELDHPALADIGELHITWGRRGRGTKSIRFGSFDFDRKLIRVHPALDQSWVPRYFVEFIVYHELLHAIFPPRPAQTKKGASRREVHTPEFRAMEKQFPHYQKAMQWESDNLRRILDSK